MATNTNRPIVPVTYHFGDVVFVRVGDKAAKMTVKEYSETTDMLTMDLTTAHLTELKAILANEPDINMQNQKQLESVLDKPKQPAQ